MHMTTHALPSVYNNSRDDVFRRDAELVSECCEAATDAAQGRSQLRRVLVVPARGAAERERRRHARARLFSYAMAQ